MISERVLLRARGVCGLRKEMAQGLRYFMSFELV
jgi:hypothetical protein